MKKIFAPLAFLLLVLITGCEKSDADCGEYNLKSVVISSSDFFAQPSEIYWGVSGNTRSYTYNWTYGNICTRQNPKVDFNLALIAPNNTLSNPFSFDAGTTTCLGVQSQRAILNPVSGQTSYESAESEIGMNQCFGGQASATIYPFLVISFTTLGSSQADSLYLLDNFSFIKSTIGYNVPK